MNATQIEEIAALPFESFVEVFSPMLDRKGWEVTHEDESYTMIDELGNEIVKSKEDMATSLAMNLLEDEREDARLTLEREMEFAA